MKPKFLMSLLLASLFTVSCTNEMDEDEFLKNSSENISLTRSCLNDTLDLGELVCLEETEEFLNLKRSYEEIHSRNNRVKALSTTADDFFLF